MSEKVKEIIAEQLNIDVDKININSDFKEDLGADSLDLFNLVMAFEDEYGVEIPSEDLEQITTVSAVIEYLKEKGADIS
ncbi:MAG: acyl carrier protein [Johnsonella sp.]|nr:acyl carrier protein [Johnsonella sp.]